VANTFDWVEIRTRDIEKAADFHGQLFGWAVVHEEAAGGLDYWILDTGGIPRTENLRRGGLWLRSKDQDVGVVVYVLVDDIEATLQKAVALGGRVVTPRTSEGPAFKAYLADPDGNIFGLWQERDID
jgi:hypothetical protein